MSFFIFTMLILKKYEFKDFYHPLILIPFSLAFLGLLSSVFSKSFHSSLSGSPQIGQGVFWYFGLAIMSIIFSKVMQNKRVKLLIFYNFLFITFTVTFFTFFPFWKEIPISFYNFTDYLCFYGVLCFILFTLIYRNKYLITGAFLFLGIYFSYLENRAASLFWFTTFLTGFIYYIIGFITNSSKIHKFRSILFSNLMFVTIILVISILTIFCSLYFWSSEFNLPLNIKDTVLDAPVVRGKIIENSLLGLNSFKSIILGTGWGMIPDLLLENMSAWHYDELRLGYNLHFHTHNDFAEHIVSLGFVGGLLFLTYIYFIFRESGRINFLSKLGWLLFFKINCFWFLWTGTFTLFALVVSCFILHDLKQLKTLSFFHKNYEIKKNITSVVFLLISIFLFYGAYITFDATKINSNLKYTNIAEFVKSKEEQPIECLNFYRDSKRGGILLDMFLSRYSSYIFETDLEKLDKLDFSVLDELQCKANLIIKNGTYTSTLLSTAIQVDTNFYYKFGSSEIGINYMKKNYKEWFQKILIMSEEIPKRGDLILPFLSYAINNGKNENAVEVCNKSVKAPLIDFLNLLSLVFLFNKSLSLFFLILYLLW